VSLLQSAQIASGAHPAVIATGIGTLQRSAKWLYRVANNTQHSAEVANERNCFFIILIYGHSSFPCLLVIRRYAMWVTESAVNKP
jgi:hypothetical protein